MSNPLDPGAGATYATGGLEQSGFLENLQAGFNVGRYVDSLGAPENMILPEYENSLRLFESRTGRKTGLAPDVPLLSELIPPMIDSNYQAPNNLLGGFEDQGAVQLRAQNLQRAREINEQIKALNDPNIKSLDQLISDMREKRGEYQSRAADASESSGVMGTIGQFLGGAAGPIAAGDPTAIIGLFAGGGSGTVARALAQDFVVGGLVGAATQEGALNPTRELLDEETVSPLQAGLEGGAAQAGLSLLFRGAGRAAGRIGERLRDNPFQMDAGNDAQLRQMFAAAPDNASARAGLSLLDEQTSFDAVNPYGKTEVGNRVFTEEVGDIFNTMEGRPSTAIARFLPEPHEPLTLDAWDFEHQVVREQQPALFDALVQATAKVNDLDTAIAEATGRVEGVGTADAIARIDPESADLVRSYQQDLADPQITGAQRAQVQRQLDIITESLPDVTRQLNDAKIGPRKELQRLEASRRAAKKDFGKVRSAVDKEIVRNQQAQRVKELVLGSRVTGQAGPARDVPINPSALRRDVVETVRAEVTTRGQALDKEVPAAPKIAEEPVEGQPAPEPKTSVSIGGREVPLDFIIDDPDVPGKSISAREFLQRMYDDEALVEAMKVCNV